jgi:hypothetical protein
MRSDTRILIQPLGFESPVAKAAQELAEYLPRLASITAQALPPRAALPKGPAARIVLGTTDHLAGLGLGPLPRPHPLDDALAILPRKGTLYLAGSNPRSVLFAAYRLLEELGVVFLRPGPHGEVVPQRGRLALPTRALREQASYRHRGICIEGAPSLEHVLAVLDWMAKKKMNTFQLQFLHAGVFWRRYYQSPELGDRLSEADCYALDDRVIARVRDLGLVLHRVGHGWTSATVGVPGMGWERTTQRPPRDKRGWLAQVNGKRELWEGIAANTELCYSQPQVREAFVEQVVTYARQHSQVDVIHVWLSDSINNKCECADCRRRSPSDWYALLIEQIGRRLKQEHLPARIVFLGYMDVLWPPERLRVTTDNAILMYAPITRCYTHALNDARCDRTSDPGRPKLNRCRLPRTNRAYAQIMRSWRQASPPDTFLFDYHMMWAVWTDGFGRDVGAVMARDVKDLAGLGLNGLLSCQAVRCFYPLPYMPNAMADLLWNKRLPTGRHRAKIMAAAFAQQADEVEACFSQLVRAFTTGGSYQHRDLREGGPSQRKQMQQLAAFAGRSQRRFAALARREKDAVVRTSLELLAVHADHASRIARAHLAGWKKDRALIRALRADYEKVRPRILQDFSHWIDPLVAEPLLQALARADRATRA